MVALAGLCRIEVADLGSNDHDEFKVPPVTQPRPHGMLFSSRLLDPARAGICRWDRAWSVQAKISAARSLRQLGT
jgi:hypothetical protein